TPALIPRFDLYLSFAGGPVLATLERKYGSPCARALCCGGDPWLYFPERLPEQDDLGYMGTYSEDRQEALETLMFAAARSWGAGRFIVAGPKYPRSIHWPDNVPHVDHLAPGEHRAFYNRQRFTLNLTRGDMVRAGYAP